MEAFEASIQSVELDSVDKGQEEEECQVQVRRCQEPAVCREIHWGNHGAEVFCMLQCVR